MFGGPLTIEQFRDQSTENYPAPLPKEKQVTIKKYNLKHIGHAMGVGLVRIKR